MSRNHHYQRRVAKAANAAESLSELSPEAQAWLIQPTERLPAKVLAELLNKEYIAIARKGYRWSWTTKGKAVLEQHEC